MTCRTHQAHHALANSLGVIVSVENKGLLGYIPKLILRPNFKSKLGIGNPGSPLCDFNQIFRRSNNLFGACFIVFTEAEDDWLGTESERAVADGKKFSVRSTFPDSHASGFTLRPRSVSSSTVLMRLEPAGTNKLIADYSVRLESPAPHSRPPIVQRFSRRRCCLIDY